VIVDLKRLKPIKDQQAMWHKRIDTTTRNTKFEPEGFNICIGEAERKSFGVVAFNIWRISTPFDRVTSQWYLVPDCLSLSLEVSAWPGVSEEAGHCRA